MILVIFLIATERRGASFGKCALHGPLPEVERAWLERALELCEGNAREVARRLGIGRATVARRLERYRQ